MAKLQKANLGVPPSGAGGDDQRTANARFNANVDVLNSVIPVEYTYLADSTTLQPFHVGSRFGLSMPAAGKTVTLPLVSSVPVNACMHFFNVGPQTTIGTQGNDGTQIRTLNTGDWAAYIADGGSFWHVAERGRMFPDEVTIGNLTVGGDVTVNGRLYVAEGSSAKPGIAFQNDGAPDTGLFHISDGVFGITCNTQEVVRFGSSGVAYAGRPTFAGRVPWDSGNFDPAKLLSDRKIGRTLLQTKKTLSNSMMSMVGITGYEVYELTLTDVVPSSNGASLSLQMSGDNGASWVSSSNAYRFVLSSTGTAPSGPQNISGTGVAITLCQSLGTTSTGMFMSGTVRFYGLGRSTRLKAIQWDLVTVLSDGNLYRISGAGQLQSSTAPLNGILFGGGFVDGSWSLYGMDA